MKVHSEGGCNNAATTAEGTKECSGTVHGMPLFEGSSGIPFLTKGQDYKSGGFGLHAGNRPKVAAHKGEAGYARNEEDSRLGGFFHAMDGRRMGIPSFFERMRDGPDSASEMDRARQADATGTRAGPLKRQKVGVESSDSPSLGSTRDCNIGVNNNYSPFRELRGLGIDRALPEQSRWPSHSGSGFGGQRVWVPPFGRMQSEMMQNSSLESFGGRSGVGMGHGLAEMSREGRPGQLFEDTLGGAGWKDGTPSIGEKGPLCGGDFTGSSGIDALESSSVKQERGIAGGRGFMRGAGCSGPLASTLLASGSAGFGSGSAFGSSAISEIDAVVGEPKILSSVKKMLSSNQTSNLVPGLAGSPGASRLVHGVWGGVRNSGRAWLGGKGKILAKDGAWASFRKSDKEWAGVEDGQNNRQNNEKESEVRGDPPGLLADKLGDVGVAWEGAKGLKSHDIEEASRMGVSRRELDEARRSMVVGAVGRSSGPASGRFPFVWRMDRVAMGPSTTSGNKMSSPLAAAVNGIGVTRADMETTKVFEVWHQKGREQDREAAIAAAKAENEFFAGGTMRESSWHDLTRKTPVRRLGEGCGEEGNVPVNGRVDYIGESDKQRESIKVMRDVPRGENIEKGVEGRRAEGEAFPERRKSEATCAVATGSASKLLSTTDGEAAGEMREGERREQDQSWEGKSGSRGGSSCRKRRRVSSGLREEEHLRKAGGQDSSSYERKSRKKKQHERQRGKIEQRERERESRHLLKGSDGRDQWSGCKTESRKRHKANKSDDKGVKYFKEQSLLDGKTKQEQIGASHVKGKGSFSAWFDVLKGGMMGIGHLSSARSTADTVGDRLEGCCDTTVEGAIEKRPTEKEEIEKVRGRGSVIVDQEEGEDRTRMFGGRLAPGLGSGTPQEVQSQARSEAANDKKETQEGGGKYHAVREAIVAPAVCLDGATMVRHVNSTGKEVAEGIASVLGKASTKVPLKGVNSKAQADREALGGNRTFQEGDHACQKGKVERLQGDVTKQSVMKPGHNFRIASGKTPVSGVGYPKASMWSLLTSPSALQPQDQQTLPGKHSPSVDVQEGVLDRSPQPEFGRSMDSSPQVGQVRTATDMDTMKHLAEKRPLTGWQCQRGRDPKGRLGSPAAAVGWPNITKTLPTTSTDQQVAFRVPVLSKPPGPSSVCCENQPEWGATAPRKPPSLQVKEVVGPHTSIAPNECDQKKTFDVDEGPASFSFLAGEQRDLENRHRREQAMTSQGGVGHDDMDLKPPLSGMSSINMAPQLPSVSVQGETLAHESGARVSQHVGNPFNDKAGSAATQAGPSQMKETGDLDGFLCQTVSNLQHSAYMPYEMIAGKLGKAGAAAPENVCPAGNKPETKAGNPPEGGSVAPLGVNMTLQPQGRVEVGQSPIFCFGDDGSGEAVKDHDCMEYKARMAAVRKWNLESAKWRGRHGREDDKTSKAGFILAEVMAMARISRLKCIFCGMGGHQLDECSETLDVELPFLRRKMLKWREQQEKDSKSDEPMVTDNKLMMQCLRCLKKGHWGSHCMLSVSEVLAIHAKSEMGLQDEGREKSSAERKVGGESSMPGQGGVCKEAAHDDNVTRRHPVARFADDKIERTMEQHSNSGWSDNSNREDSADRDSVKQRKNAPEETCARRGFEYQHEGRGGECMSERGAGLKGRGESEWQDASSRSRRKRDKLDVEKERSERKDMEERARGMEDRLDRDKGKGKEKDSGRHREKERGKERGKEQLREISPNDEDSKALQGGQHICDRGDDNNGGGQVKSVSQLPMRAPPGMLQAIESVRLPRRELIRLAGKRDFSACVSGFFLRLRFGRKSEGPGRSGYRMARIRGAAKESEGGDNDRLALDVDFGDFTCTIDGQYVSNKSFNEVELQEWWNGGCRTKGHHPISLEQIKELRDSLSHRP